MISMFPTTLSVTIRDNDELKKVLSILYPGLLPDLHPAGVPEIGLSTLPTQIAATKDVKDKAPAKKPPAAAPDYAHTPPTARAEGVVAPAKTESAPPPPAERAEVAPRVSTVVTDATEVTEVTEVAEVDFNTLKKAFLALCDQPGGRAKCESILPKFGIKVLSLAKPEQYAGIHAAILEASK